MSGIFTLGQVGRKQEGSTWGTVSDVFLTEKRDQFSSTYGYAGGGNDSSLIFRINFASDSTEAPARSRLAKASNWHCASVASKNYGYWNGAYPGNSIVERLDFANDTVVNTAVSNLTRSTAASAPIHNLDYGYICGGNGGLTIVDRIDFGNDTAISLVRGNLAVAPQWAMGGTGNQSYGYVAGGSSDSAPTTMNRIDYASDSSTATPKGPLSVARGRCKAIGNSAYGYWAGGGPTPLSSVVDRLDFSSDTTTMAPKGNLPVAARGLNTTGHQNSGYFCSGSPGPSNNARLDYDNDTVSPVQRGYLAGGTYMGSGTGNRTCGRPIMTNNYSAGVPYGYFAGGDEPGVPGQVSKIDRLDYDNDTVACLHKGNMTSSVEQCISWSTLNYFYTTNGTGSKVQRLSYMNDTATASERSSGGIYPAQRRFGVQNTNYGYVGGGPHPAGISTIARIDFNNDTSTALVKGPLTGGRYAAGGLSSQSYGYVCGGSIPFASPAYKSWVDRIDFSNDTATAPTRANLPAEIDAWSGSSSLAYGYLSGSSATVYRIDFSTDTTAAAPKGPLAGGNGGYAGSTSNDKSYGYWAGGDSGTSKIHRLDFTNDTSTGTEKGPLSAGRRWVWEGGSSSKEAVLQGGMTSHTFLQTDSDSISPDPGKIESYLTGQDWDYSAFDQLSISPGYGYFMGGGNPGSISTIDRIEFGNDTADAVVKGNLSHISRRIGAFTSLNYGYRCGGYNADTNAAITDIERLDYTNDTGTLGDAGYLTVARHFGAGLSTKDYGYLGGGEDPSSVKSTVDRLDFSTDTTTAVAKGPLSVARKGTAAVMSADYGYWGGGTEPSNNRTTVDRIDFASDTTACAPKGPLSEALAYLSGTNSADFGYIGGGNQPSSPYQRSTVDKISFSNDTATAVVKGPLTIAKHNGASTGNQNYGYFGGGETPSLISTVDRITYANDTVAATAKGPLTDEKGEGFAGTSNRALVSQIKLKGLNTTFSEVQGPLTSYTTNYGYFAGGFNTGVPAKYSEIDRVDFSNDTATASLRNHLPSVLYGMGATSNQSYGYFIGGHDGSNILSRVDRIDYSNDSAAASARGSLPDTLYYHVGAAGNKDYGWIAGGQDPGHPSGTTEVHRIDYANDLVLAAVRGPLSEVRFEGAASGNPAYGWFAGGSNKTTVDRVDYSNDTPTASPRGQLLAPNGSFTATGNDDYGYYSGGNYNTKIDRIDYSSDTTIVAKGNLSEGRVGSAGGSNNSSHGYMGGGTAPGPYSPSPGSKSTVDRIDFASDTAIASLRGPLTIARNYFQSASAKGNALPESYTSTVAYSNGTSFGGYNGGGLYRKSNIERMDYSNDSVDPINKANFPRGLESNNGAVSSLISGYWCGGETNPNPTTSSTINRLDYANDTNVMTVGNKTAGSKANGAFGNKNYGYCASDITTMERLDYANDLAGMLGRSTGNPTISERGCTASADYGYYNSGGSKVDRLDFANDTVAASQRTSLTYAIGGRSSAVGNVNYGWWFGSGPTTVGRVDYSNDTETATVRGYLQTLSPVSATYASGHGNENYGYVQGYYQSTIQRIDYSNDMATPITRGVSKVTLGGAMSAGTSCRENSLSLHTIGQTTKDWQSAFAAPIEVVPSSQSAYWIGGNPSYTKRIQRLIIASDTLITTARGSTSASMSDTRSGVGNKNYGYLDITSSNTNIERLDYANDTAGSSTHLFAAEARQQRGGTSTENYGYIAGGSPSNSFIDRIDFNSDTTTALARGPLAAATTHCRGVGNTSYGYFGTGSITNVQRLDYSSDTDAAILKADGLSGWGANATGNASYGYWGGGGPGSTRTDVRRLDYSSDTTTLAPKGPLSAGRSEHAAATGNISYGYWAGGEPASTNDTKVSRIDYSNDTATALGRGPLVTRIRDGNKLSGGHDALPQ